MTDASSKCFYHFEERSIYHFTEYLLGKRIFWNFNLITLPVAMFSDSIAVWLSLISRKSYI